MVISSMQLQLMLLTCGLGRNNTMIMNQILVLAMNVFTIHKWYGVILFMLVVLKLYAIMIGGLLYATMILQGIMMANDLIENNNVG